MSEPKQPTQAEQDELYATFDPLIGGGRTRVPDSHPTDLDLARAEIARLREERDSQQRVCIEAMSTLAALRAQIPGLVKDMVATADRLVDHSMAPDLNTQEAGAHARAGAIVRNFSGQFAKLLPPEPESAARCRAEHGDTGAVCHLAPSHDTDHEGIVRWPRTIITTTP